MSPIPPPTAPIDDPADHQPAGPTPPDPASDALELVRTMAGLLSALPTVDELAIRLGWAAGRISAAVESARTQVLASPWSDHPAGPVVTLSPLAAARFGLRPKSVYSMITLPNGQKRKVESFVWTRATDREASPRMKYREDRLIVLETDLVAEGLSPLLAGRPDPLGPCSEDVADALDAIVDFRRGRIDRDRMAERVGRAVAQVGTGVPWGAWDPDKPCPTCGGRRDAPEMRGELTACVRCYAAPQLDALIGHVAPLPPDRPKRAYVKGLSRVERLERRRQKRRQKRAAMNKRTV